MQTYIFVYRVEKRKYLEYLCNTFDRSLFGNEHVTLTRLAFSFKRMHVAKFQTKVRKIVMKDLIKN